MIRVLVADDNKLFRDGLCLLLRRCSDIELAAQAADGKEAVELVGKVKPHVVLMDLKMPVMDGFEATRQIHLVPLNGDRPAVLVVTGSYDAEMVKRALESGAKGYIAKHEFANEIAPGVRAVAEGKNYFSRSILPLLPSQV